MRKFLVLTIVLFAVISCTRQRAELGSEQNPIKLFFTPSVDVKVIEDSSKKLKEYLEAQTKYKFEVSIPQNYIAVVEAFGTSRADVSALNTFGYILAHDKYGAQAYMTVLRHGSSTYQSQFIAKADSSIKKIEDFKGKKVAFVDPASTSGYLLPLKMLKDKAIDPSESVFAMKHDNVVSMVYNGQVDGGATFYSPPTDGQIEDARRLVKTQYPDVEQKISIIQLSDPIPNDPIVFRKDMPEDMKKKIVETFMSFVKTDEGKKVFKAIYGVDDLKLATDADYDSVRAMLKALGKSAQEMTK
jgi:phosphonate transport system substrate-binding protein